ncbi:MAG: hypothetical protein HRF50_14695 [Phycisphaerae bacterium]|jgi:hypothetical protein
MNPIDRQAELRIDQELGAWAELLDRPTPAPDTLQRVRAAVRAAARRERSARPLSLRMRSALGIAAAAALALVLTAPPLVQTENTPNIALQDDPAALLADWSAALDDSQELFSRLLEDDPWLLTDPAEVADPADAIDALDESLERFEEILGA